MCDHSLLQSWPIKSAPLITFKSAVAQHRDNFNMAADNTDRIHQPNFTQEETDVLVQEVHSLKEILFVISVMKRNVLVTSLMF